MIDLSTTALKIQNARKEKGFTQDELASRLGVSAQAISKWERALSLPDIELLLDLSKILGMSVESLLDNSYTDHSNSKKTEFDIINDKILFLLRADQISVQMGAELVPCFTEEFISKFAAYRYETLLRTGALLPIIRIVDNIRLSPNACKISINNRSMWQQTFDPASTNFEAIGQEIMIHFNEIINANLYEFVDRHSVKILVETLRNQLPFAVDGVIPERISLTRLKIILKSLVKNNFPIKSLLQIIEIIDEQVEEKKDTEQIIAFLKNELSQ